ncbi:MAG TPA: hypothetical protein VIF43_04300 [Patescibacteria group bacterium]|jgi:hypothetical protein
MLKDFILFIKYPYTAGVISAVWIGTAILIGIDPDLPILKMVIINCIVTYLVALIGFRGVKE